MHLLPPEFLGAVVIDRRGVRRGVTKLCEKDRAPPVKKER